MSDDAFQDAGHELGGSAKYLVGIAVWVRSDIRHGLVCGRVVKQGIGASGCVLWVAKCEGDGGLEWAEDRSMLELWGDQSGEMVDDVVVVCWIERTNGAWVDDTL